MAVGARLGTGYVDIKGDFSPLEREIAAKLPALGKQIDAAFDRRSTKGFETKTTRLGKSIDGLRTKVGALSDKKVDLDTSKLDRKLLDIRKELAEIGVLKADPDVDLDTSSFDKREKILRAEMARISAMKAEVKIDTDRSSNNLASLSGNIFKTNANFSLLRNTISTLRFPVLVGAVGAAADGLVAAAGGAISLTSALAPLSGALVVVPEGLSAAAQAGGTLALALGGVGDALGAMSDQQAGAGQAATQSAAQQEQAARQVESAEDSLAAAKRTAKYAEEDLTAARDEAIRQLEDMRTAAISASDAEKSSALSLREAKKALEEARVASVTAGPGEAPSLLEIRQLEQAVTEAKHAHASASIDASRAQEDLNKAERQGIQGSDQVVAARRAQADAQRGVTDATEALAQAQKDAARQMNEASSAASTLDQKMAALPPAAREFVKYLFALKPELDDLRETAAEGLFPGLESGIDKAMRNLPALDHVVGSTAKELGTLADESGRFLGRDGFGKDFETLGERNISVIDHMGDTTFNLADALRDVLIEGGPLVEWIAEGIEHWSRYIEESAAAGRESGELSDFFRETKDVMGDVVSIGGSLFNVLMDIDHAAQPFGGEMLDDLRDGANDLERLTGSVEGQNKLSEYFQDSYKKLRKFGRALVDILDEGSIGGSVAKAIELAIPEITKHAGRMGEAIATGLVHGVRHADFIGKLFIGATLFKLFGGGSVLKKAGTTIGTRLGAAAGPAMALGLITLGLTDKKFRAAAAEGGKRIGELFVNGMIGAINAGLEQIFDGSSGLSGLPGIGEYIKGLTGGDGIAPQIDPVAFSDYQKVIDSGVKEPAQRGLDAVKGLKSQIKDLDKVMDQSRPSIKKNAESLDAFGDRLDAIQPVSRKTQNVLGDYFREVDRGTGVANRAIDNHQGHVKGDLGKISGDLDKGGKEVGRYSKDAADSFGWLVGRSGKMAKGVSANNASMVNAVGEGQGVLRDNTKRALKDFGVTKSIDYAIKLAKKATHTISGLQQGGQAVAKVPGTAPGDRHILALNGTPIAAVESQEGIFVGNRTFTSALEAGNRNIPRRKDGGSVPHLAGGGGVGGDTGGLHPGILGLVNSLSRYGATVSSGYRPTDSGSLHSTGQAADVVFSDWAGASRAVNAVGSKLLEGIYNPASFGGSPVSWDTGQHVSPSFWADEWANHLDHIHLAVADGGKAIAGAVAEKLKRVLLKGPDGPLKEMGQAALDKVRTAGDKFIASKMPTGTGDTATSTYSGPLDHTFPHPGGPAIAFKDAAMLAESVGLPGITYAQIAIGESTLRPGAVSSDGGYGLWQMTPRVQSPATVAAWERVGSYFNPVNNAEMAKILAGGGTGVENYHGTGSVTDWNAHYKGKIPSHFQQGGLVKLAGGGGPGDKSKGKGHSIDFHVASGLGVPITEASKIARKLKALTAGRGAIAKLDERISIADTLANADDDLTPAEIDKLVGLNRKLLGDLQIANKLSGQGYRIARKGIHSSGSSSTTKGKLRELMGMFRETQTDLSGVTGKGGRIFDTTRTIADLLGTTQTPAPIMDVSGLRDVIEAAQFGVFRDLPKFHEGGIYRAPVGRNEGPAMLEDGERVSRADGETFVGYATIDLGEGVTQRVRLEFDKRERHEHRRARAYAR